MNCAYVVRRRKGLYVRKAVPPALREIIGKEHVLQSLKTRDMAEANRRKWAVLAEIEALFAKARRGTVVKGGRDLNAEALALRDEWERADPDTALDVLDEEETTEREIVDRIAAHRAEELERRYGLPAAQRFYKLATARMLPLSMALEAWLKEREESKAVTRQTRNQDEAAVREMIAILGDVGITEIDKAAAIRFVRKKKEQGAEGAKTLVRKLSSISSFWKWACRNHAEIDEKFKTVWSGLVETRGMKKKKGERGKKRPYTKEELVQLLSADPRQHVSAKYARALSDLMRMGLLLGCRLEEMCNLQRRDVLAETKEIFIRDGKTNNAVWKMPVHEAIWPIIQRRFKVTEADRDPLFPELPPGGPSKDDRGWTTSKRYTDLRRAVFGLTEKTDPGELDFHSFRRSFSTYMENAQAREPISDSIFKELMGHAKGSLAKDGYSGGLQAPYRRKGIEALGREIESDVMAAIRASVDSRDRLSES